METTTRLIVKSVTWQALGIVVMSVVGYAFTGSLGTGGALALTLSAIGLVMYILHERLWARVRWGRRAAEMLQPGGPVRSS